MTIFNAKYLFSFILLCSILYACVEKDVECKAGINLMPMYGNVQKCKSQLEADQRFLTLSDKEEPNRKLAAINMMDKGWYYIHQGDYDTAMKRMNQSWLLDSTNIIVYASFAVVLDLMKKPDEAIKMLDITFEKEKFSNSTSMNLSNESLINFVIDNALFVYKKTTDSSISKYMYQKLDDFDIPETQRDSLRFKLKNDISDIN